MEQAINLAGIILVVLAAIHAGFPRYFDWKTQFTSLSMLSRQMIHVHTFFIALTVLLNGLLCLCCSVDLIHSLLGRRICAGLAVFWTLRLCCQLFIYSPVLWRGKTFETIIHILFSFIWAYLSVVFIWVAVKG